MILRLHFFIAARCLVRLNSDAECPYGDQASLNNAKTPQTHLNDIDWEIWAAIKKYNPSIMIYLTHPYGHKSDDQVQWGQPGDCRWPLLISYTSFCGYVWMIIRNILILRVSITVNQQILVWYYIWRIACFR